MNLNEKIVDFLDCNDITYKLYKHFPVKTSIEAAQIRGSKLSEGAKALIFIADNEFVQVIIEGDKKVDKDKFKKFTKVSKFKMVSPDEVKNISAVETGAVPPFANLFQKPLKMYVNKSLLTNEYMEFNAGDRRISIRMKVKDWYKLVKPIEFNLQQ